MSDINQTITLGIGSPSGIKEFLTFGLQTQPPATPIVTRSGTFDSLQAAAATIDSQQAVTETVDA